MADAQLLDPSTVPGTQALATDNNQAAAKATDPGALAADPGAANTVTGPDKPLSADTASSLFGHVATPDASLGLTPRKVKTESIKHSTAGLLDAISTGTEINPQRSAKRQATIRSSAENMLEAAADAGLHGANQYAYMLATAERESHLGNMMDEGGGDKYFNRKYGPQTPKGQELGNTHKGDGALFHGRGLVQITGRTNYADWTRRLNDQGVQVDGADADLVNNPEQAKDPKIAAKIAAEGMRDGSFTKKHKLGDYVNDDQTDYVGARRVINGQDHAQDIADRATAFEGIINQHKGEFYGEMMASEMKNLPTAHEGQLSGDAANPTRAMLDPTPIGGPLGSFEPIDQFAKKHHAGRFVKDPKPKDQPANVPIPIPRPKDL
ncbi:MAG: hypothetical protein U1A78_31175 [Polyangia bacterium]